MANNPLITSLGTRQRISKHIQQCISGNDLNKAVFSSEERKKLAESGEAKPDGSFPIRTAKDVKNAVRDWGRAGSRASDKEWIKKRAKELDCEESLPADWKDDKLEKSHTSGEGSKGGKIIGHTKSGKPIYQHKQGHSAAYKNFTSKEHKEAGDIHYEYGNKHGGITGKNHLKTAGSHFNQTDEGKKQTQKQNSELLKEDSLTGDLAREKQSDKKLEKSNINNMESTTNIRKNNITTNMSENGSLTKAVLNSKENIHDSVKSALLNTKNNRIDYINSQFEKSSIDELNAVSEEKYEVFTEESIQRYENDLNKSFTDEEISLDDFEKGMKDIYSLDKRIIIDKNGKKQTVYVRKHSETGKQHEFKKDTLVSFEHKGEKKTGKIHELKHHDKYDPFGTAIIHDEAGNKYSKSLRAIEHQQWGDKNTKSKFDFSKKSTKWLENRYNSMTTSSEKQSDNIDELHAIENEIESRGENEKVAKEPIKKPVEEKTEKTNVDDSPENVGIKIGKTASDKIVYSAKPAKSYKDFDKKDHASAANLHRQKSQEHFSNKYVEGAKHHDEMESQHAKLAGKFYELKKKTKVQPGKHSSEVAAGDGEYKPKHVSNIPEKNTPEWHQLQIAKKTVAMSPAMASVMGGMDIDEAKKILAKYNVNVRKGEDDELEKSEGSRGGKIIGHTKSGKPIYQHKDKVPTWDTVKKQHQDFTKKDHEDAAELHSNLAEEYGKAHLKEYKKHQGKRLPKDWTTEAAEESKKHRAIAVAHQSLANWTDKKTGKIKKSNDDELEKGGEGSKGGKIIGHTKSGKPIYGTASYKESVNYAHSDKHSNFTSKDHEDASKLHSNLAAKFKKERSEHDLGETMHVHLGIKYKNHEKHANSHAELANKKAIEEAGSNKEQDDIKKSEQSNKIRKSLAERTYENMLEKGEISNSLSGYWGNGQNKIEFTKTGKEIKEKVPSIIAALATKLAELRAQMAEYEKECGISPCQPNSSSVIKYVNGYDTYSWEDINKWDKDHGAETRSVDNPMRKYNNACFVSLSLAEDMATLETLKNNVNEKKSYELSVNQLISLGFNEG